MSNKAQLETMRITNIGGSVNTYPMPYFFDTKKISVCLKDLNAIIYSHNQITNAAILIAFKAQGKIFKLNANL